MQNPALMAVKTAILVFYMALTKTERIFRWANFTTLFVVIAAGIALTFVNIFQCHPVDAAFTSDLAINENQCTSVILLYLASSPANVVTDLSILFLPMPLLTKMLLPMKEKIILVITFGFGFFVAVVDVIRIAYLQGAFDTHRITLIHIGQDDDFTCNVFIHIYISSVPPANAKYFHRVCFAVVHVVCCRGERFNHLWVCTGPETLGGSHRA